MCRRRIDWDRPPWNRWAFQHIREILPTAEVWRGNGHRKRLERAERDLDALAVSDSEGTPTTLAGLLDETYTDGFLVLKDGRIAYERYFNGMTERTLHLSQSVAKSVIGTVFGILAGRGVVDPARPVTDYLPELAATGWAGASLQHVLDMTSGVRFSEEYTDPYSDIGQVDVASRLEAGAAGHRPEFPLAGAYVGADPALDRSRRGRMARAFEYRSIESDVLAFVMERVTGKRLAELVSEELWQKIGADESACFTVDSAGYALADGGFNATLRDYGRFGLTDPRQWRRHRAARLDRGDAQRHAWRRLQSRLSRGLLSQPVLDRGSALALADVPRRVRPADPHRAGTARMVVVKLSTWPDFGNVPYSVATLAAIHAIEAAAGRKGRAREPGWVPRIICGDRQHVWTLNGELFAERGHM